MTFAAGADLADQYAYCEALVKEADRHAWLATLFAPADKRPAFHALIAFAQEVSSIRRKVREPMAGELRLQWWVDAIEGEARGDLRGHPVAAALLDTIDAHNLPRTAFAGLIDAKRNELYADPVSDLDAFDIEADQTEGALIRLKAQVCTGAPDPMVTTAAGHAGRALAVLGILRALGNPTLLANPRLPLTLLKKQGIGPADLQTRTGSPAIRRALRDIRAHARDQVVELRRLRPRLDPASGPAFLEASLVQPTLRRRESNSLDPFNATLALPQWRVQWTLWRAAGRGGIL